MNNINQNANATGQLLNTLKAQASGALQDTGTIKKQEAPAKVRQLNDPLQTQEANIESFHTKDEVSTSIKKIFEHGARRSLESDQEPQYQLEDDGTQQQDKHSKGQVNNNDASKGTAGPLGLSGGVKWLKGIFQTLAQILTKQNMEMTELPFQPPSLSLQQQEEKESRTSHTLSVNRFLSGWTDLSPTTINGLERFLEVEFSYKQDDYKLFLQRQMVKLVSDSNRNIGEQELAAMHNELPNSETLAKQAMIGVALLGFAYYKLSLKRRKNCPVTPEEFYALEENRVIQEIKKRKGERRLKKAKTYLKEVERELEGALAEGADEETIQDILKKILILSGQISEMAMDEALV